MSEAANVSRDNLISLLQMEDGATERNAQLEEKIAANTARRDILLKNYEALISDDEDRRLFEDVKRARDVMTASRSRAIELMKENKADESRKMQQEVVVPDYEKYLKAIDLDIDYNEKLAKTHADDGKASALLSVRLVGICLGLLILWRAFGMGNYPFDQPRPWQHHGQPRPWRGADRLGRSAGIDGEPNPCVRRQ